MCGGSEVAYQPQALAIVVDPAGQTGPAGDEGLVCDLYGGLARFGVAVEREQARRSIVFDDFVDAVAIRAERGQFAQSRPAARIGRTFAERDDASEHLSCRVARGRRELVVDLVGASSERARDSTDCLVAGECERVVFP